MRGSKHSDEIRERAYALLASCESVSATAKALRLSYSTVDTWYRGWQNKKSSKLEASTQTGAGESNQNSENLKFQSKDGADSSGGETNDEPSEKSLEELREEMKRSFVKRACKMIDDTQSLLERRIARAVHKEDVLDELLSMVEERSDKLTDKEKERIVSRIAGLRLDDIRALSSILATLWDKQALAMKEPTLNVGGSVRFEDL